VDDGVEPRVLLLDARYRRLDELSKGDLNGVYKLGLLGGVHPRKVVHLSPIFLGGRQP